MKGRKSRKIIIVYLLILTLFLETIVFSTSVFASENEEIYTLLEVDPFEPIIRTQISRLSHNTA